MLRDFAKFSVISKLWTKTFRLKIRSCHSFGENGRNSCVLYFFCFTRLHAYTGRNLCFHDENCQQADQKQLKWRHTLDPDIESNHGQLASCCARSMNVDDGLEHIRWIRGRGCERLPAASYALLPNLKSFCHRGGIEDSSRLVLRTRGWKFFFARRLAGARHASPAVSWTLWSVAVSEPLTNSPRSELVTQSSVLSIDMCGGLGTSPLRFKRFAEFLSGRYWPNNCPGIIFSLFWKDWNFLFWRFVLMASSTKILWRLPLKFKPFLATSRFHCHGGHAFFFLFHLHAYYLCHPGSVSPAPGCGARRQPACTPWRKVWSRAASAACALSVQSRVNVVRHHGVAFRGARAQQDNGKPSPQ